MALKVKFYRWSDGADGKPKAGYRDVPETKKDTEVAEVWSQIENAHYGPRIDIVRFFDRFSSKKTGP